jgi:hypothetical protein
MQKFCDATTASCVVFATKTAAAAAAAAAVLLIDNEGEWKQQ